jgi:transposase
MSKGIRRSFPEMFKREAVKRVRTSGLSIKAIAVELGAHETVLRKWVRAHSGAQTTGAVTRPITQAPPPSASEPASANARLRRENERLRKERDTKKATLIFGAASR